MPGAERPWVSGSIEGVEWQLFDAWRAASGLGLGFFVRGDRGSGDRRVELAPEQAVADLAGPAFEELWARGRGLTASERRLADAAGELWLVQGVGPVWAERGTAAGATGIRLRCISAERPIVGLTGRALADTFDEELLEAIERTLAADSA